MNGFYENFEKYKKYQIKIVGKNMGQTKIDQNS